MWGSQLVAAYMKCHLSTFNCSYWTSFVASGEHLWENVQPEVPAASIFNNIMGQLKIRQRAEGQGLVGSFQSLGLWCKGELIRPEVGNLMFKRGPYLYLYVCVYMDICIFSFSVVCSFISLCPSNEILLWFSLFIRYRFGWNRERVSGCIDMPLYPLITYYIIKISC